MYLQKEEYRYLIGIKQIIIKNLFLVGILEVPDGKSRIQIRIRKSSGRIQSKDPDPYKNVTDL
jgi:hypothetical protein